MAIRILLADDHVLVRQALRNLLEISGFVVVGEASDGWEAVRLARESHPDAALLDLEMPSLNGLDCAKEIQQVSPGTRMILVTMHRDDQLVLNAFRCGIKGYVLKSRSCDELIRAIHEVVEGNTYFLSSGIAGSVVEAFLAGRDTKPDPLTARERQVLQLIAEGRTTKEAANILNLSVSTAETHRENIMRKLGVHTVSGLVLYAIRQGLIQAPARV